MDFAYSEQVTGQRGPFPRSTLQSKGGHQCCFGLVHQFPSCLRVWRSLKKISNDESSSPFRVGHLFNMFETTHQMNTFNILWLYPCNPHSGFKLNTPIYGSQICAFPYLHHGGFENMNGGWEENRIPICRPQASPWVSTMIATSVIGNGSSNCIDVSWFHHLQGFHLMKTSKVQLSQGPDHGDSSDSLGSAIARREKGCTLLQTTSDSGNLQLKFSQAHGIRKLNTSKEFWGKDDGNGN